ncbi:ferric siderophore receptor [Lasius niger]|uniref:Ferric siderophore receptor n=1 Tax=Lasius niger TaxID=67767 RepID=A0A0J7KU62_LASNI|nr:ferric siderophore receptor [Lasius niger]
MQTSHDVIENQQLRTVDQMVGFMPSVQIQPKGDNPVFTGIINRGFTADKFSNSRVDGLNASFSTPLATEEVDHLSILNGMSGAVYGPESPAGMVEVALKRPTIKPFFNFNFGYDSNASPLESLDTSFGKGPIKIRFNYMNQTGQMYVKGSNQWRNAYSGDIDIQLAKHTKLELDGSQYNMSYSGLPGIFTYGNNIMLPDAPSAATPGYGQAQGGVNASTSMGVMKLKHDFSRNLHLTLGGLYQSSPSYNHSITNNLFDNQGDYHQSVTAIPVGREFSMWSNMAYLNATLHTGAVLHHFNLGTNGYTAKMDSPLQFQSFEIGNGSLANPQMVDGPQPKFSGSYHQSTTQQQSLLFGDDMDIGKYFSVMGQFSWGWINLENENKQHQITSQSHAAGAFSPAVGATFHPAKSFSAYFNWGQSIGAGIQASAGSLNAGEMLPIYHSEQYEGGIKYLYRNRISFNLDGFTMTRPYAFTDPVTHLYAYNGLQRDSGIEFQTSGSLTSEISVLGGVTWLHPFLEHSSTPLIAGKEIAGVPEWASDFLLDYHPHFLHGVAFNRAILFAPKKSSAEQETKDKEQAIAHAMLPLPFQQQTDGTHNGHSEKTFDPENSQSYQHYFAHPLSFADPIPSDHNSLDPSDPRNGPTYKKFFVPAEDRAPRLRKKRRHGGPRAGGSEHLGAVGHRRHVVKDVEKSSNAETTIGRATLEHFAEGTNALQALAASTPGASFNSGDAAGLDAFANTFYLRGYNQTQLGYTMDGIPLGNQGYGGQAGADANQIIIQENIASLSASQGAGSLETPSSTLLGGTVTYTTLDPSNKFGVHINQQFGSFNGYRTFGRLDSGVLNKTGTKFYASFLRNSQDLWTNSDYSRTEMDLLKPYGGGNQKPYGYNREESVNFKLVQPISNFGKLTLTSNWADQPEYGISDVNASMKKAFGYGAYNLAPDYNGFNHLAGHCKNNKAPDYAGSNLCNLGYDYTEVQRVYLEGLRADFQISPSIKTSSVVYGQRMVFKWLET